MFSIIVVWGKVEGREVNALNSPDQGHQGMRCVQVQTWMILSCLGLKDSCRDVDMGSPEKEKDPSDLDLQRHFKEVFLLLNLG